MAGTRILVIEDEPALLEVLRYNLEREGYTAFTAADGEAGLAQARERPPDLVILDLMLPKLGGLEVCRLLRRDSPVPILMLTAKAEESDKIVGLDLGADDYVTKPFSLRELLARVRALLRRRELARGDEPPGPLVANGLEVDVARRAAALRGAPLELKPKEFDLLAFFLAQRGLVLSRERLLERVWGYDFPGGTRTVDVHVHWLREKIEEDPGHPRRLLTVRGVGYKFEG